ncbi:MAG: FMN-binding negative transcriptional regulator [Enterovibrio sp.]
MSLVVVHHQPLAVLALKERNLHIPEKFKQENIDELVGQIRKHPFAPVVTQSYAGIAANHLPLSLIELDGYKTQNRRMR